MREPIAITILSLLLSCGFEMVEGIYCNRIITPEHSIITDWLFPIVSL